MHRKIPVLIFLLLLMWGSSYAQIASTWKPFAYQGPYLDRDAIGSLDSPARLRLYYELMKTTIKPTALEACNAAYLANFQFYFGVTPPPVRTRVDQTVNGLECWMKRIDDPRSEPMGWTGAFGDYGDNKYIGAVCSAPAFVSMQIDLLAQGGDFHSNWMRQWRSNLPPSTTKGPWFDEQSGLCQCLPGSILHSSNQFCIASPEQLSLSGATETRPAGTDGSSTISFTAKITTTNGQPKAGVTLSFSADVKPNSGGHDHDSTARPKGTVSPVQGVTNANGELVVTFTAPEIAGIHTIKATCATCSNSPVTKEIQVKVPNLVEMLPDTAKPATYTLVGENGKHKSNHWFSAKARDTLVSVADAMFKTGWGVVGINDGSLKWGGLFDIKGGWTPSHHEHRMGTEVDLSVTNPRNVTEQQKKNTFRELCRKDNSAFSIQTLWHQDDGYPEHFHMYLDGTGLTSQAGGGPCCARYKTTRVKLDKAGNPVPGKNGKPVQETVMLCTETSPR